MSLVRWDPWREMSSLRQSVERAFDDAFHGEGEGGATPERAWAPRCDIKETDSALVVSADLPGMKLEDIAVELHGDALTLKGERRYVSEETGENVHRVERAYGSFYRTFTFGVPVNPEGVTAGYKDGVLTVNVPKAEEAKPKRVEIAAA
ncbi:MAG: hypothetical protein COZ06_18270 [Armatimonadetes bacterium CG_4_10_14_3_um_filter_66_18]|nr:MAG: hypothetical protein COS65_14315 [Armatimonadetes bacterium CG06_land_8_20_14_3_00_66_21]PIX50162.1 MAG: hypothetical protein COZ57_00310 [Armatimonadetes bacterium CG_4_8_14_3_um_filter_66_20]PIY46700.1 MAG: hypothetical protein COZ06_18270 [Armatimonadetes bacterium CG_4_10_14_3_um_filter_66_18]PIZ41112.1 MAG: hypothetical protein COY42_19955 [Armatimonadetes bacterium CG_4_10_14_0_8_um_filter_66_14]PJB75671.1 MAG: hypothetical protein CO096_01630 [Armatimonadetes bacterium CG_4_9_14_